ncbi:unnamed protein product [Lymnaea stagnalis]|uniref:GDP-D-glucose phosphorylase 1 n=1 Tax=Lymnaea stagnalis TaxID=6523 RepID=A0AAV2H7H5_LYMST
MVPGKFCSIYRRSIFQFKVKLHALCQTNSLMTAGNSEDNTYTYTYTHSDFTFHTSPWEDTSPQQLSKFDLELHKRWDHAMATGVFRYNIDHIVTRILPGPKHYVGQLNTLRATERRKPQEITSVCQPFNPNAFNFTWVKPEEVVFNLRNTTTLGKKQVRGSVSSALLNGAANNHTTDCQKDDLVNGHSSEEFINTDVPGKLKDQPERHTLIVNVSPMEYGHCLLVPQIDSHRPQVLTETAVTVAIETMLLSKHRGFRMGFNSLCAFASVNHLHFHVYYLEHELIVDYCPVQQLGGKIFEITTIPCPGFALQLHGSSIQELAKRAHKITTYFHENDIAHNIFMCRGTVFGEERNSTLTTLRLYIWPRKKFIGIHNEHFNTEHCVCEGGTEYTCNKSSEEFNVACIELGGHLPIKEEDGYHKLTEKDVDAIIADACLPSDTYRNIQGAITEIGVADLQEHSNTQ